MKKRTIQIIDGIVGIVSLLMFISSHFLMTIYFNSEFKLIYFWVWGDIFLYLAIGLSIYIIVILMVRHTNAT